MDWEATWNLLVSSSPRIHRVLAQNLGIRHPYPAASIYQRSVADVRSMLPYVLVGAHHPDEEVQAYFKPALEHIIATISSGTNPPSLLPGDIKAVLWDSGGTQVHPDLILN